MDKLLLRAARGEWTERPPVWMMRQAGRHIPRYREIRRTYDFREAIETPAVAEEITLLPWELYEPDGIVMFADILTVFEPLGLEYHLEAGVGPVIENPVTAPSAVPSGHDDVARVLDFVGELLTRLQERVGDRTAIIGFAGGPFTLASYAVAGRPSSTHAPLRRFRIEHPEAFEALLETITDVTIEYLQFQADSGAEVLQLFDTYAGILTPSDYREFLLPLHQRIVESVDPPTIVFARNMAGHLDLLEASGADVVGLDWTVDMASARAELGATPVQGNLDPLALFGSAGYIEAQTQAVIDAAGPEGHILNLGHGLHRETPIEGVRTFVETAKAIDR